MKTKQNRQYWRNLALYTLICIFIGAFFLQYVGYPYYLSYGHSHPKPLAVCCEAPVNRGLAYEDVTFTTQDGLNLSGWYIPSKNNAVIILLHDLATNRLAMLDLAELLAGHGYGILLFDLRAHGESDGDIYHFGGPEAEDIRAAVAYLQKNRDDIDPEYIGIVGWSLGAQTAIMGAYAEPSIKAIVADGPGATTFSDWPSPKTVEEWYYLPHDFFYYRFLTRHTGVTNPMSLKEALSNMTARPILFISSGLPTEQHRLENLFESAQEPKSFWLVPEAGHLGNFRLQPEAYETQIITFFDEHLLDSSE